MAASVDGAGSKTAAINHYDGIFKFVHGSAAQECFQRGRELLSTDRWSEALAAFKEAKVKAEDDGNNDYNDVDTLDLVLQEMTRYKDSLIPDTPATPAPKPIDWSSVAQRPISRHEEPNDRLPQGLFLMYVGKTEPRRRLVGRKTLSDKWLKNLIPELFCSLIRPGMVLGELVNLRVTESSYVAFYSPLQPAEKLQLFHDVYGEDGLGVEITHPFPLLKTSTSKEFTSPSEGWQVDNAYDDMLSNGETHIRSYTEQLLKSLKLSRPRLYDPACSTGVFLSSLQTALPDSYTIGQDLSQQMADVSRPRLNEAHHGNALQPKIQLGSATAVFIRFLNSEVVTSAEAETLLPPLLKTVAVGGLFVLFGHTPLLLSSANFRSLPGFRLESCVAVDVEKKGIFQYYVLKRAA